MKNADEKYSVRSAVFISLLVIVGGIEVMPAETGTANQTHNSAGVESCTVGPTDENILEHFSFWHFEKQEAYIKHLLTSSEEAAIAIPPLCDFLKVADGKTEDRLIGNILNVFRNTGVTCRQERETLSKLLSHSAAIYQSRDKLDVIRLRAQLFVVLSEIGVPDVAIPHLFDSLAHPDERVVSIEVGAAARAAGSLGTRGTRLVPYLLKILDKRFAEEEFSLDLFTTELAHTELTTVQLEALRAIGRIGSLVDSDAQKLLHFYTTSGNATDPRLAQEAIRTVRLVGASTALQ